jgi:hypothetical protein
MDGAQAFTLTMCSRRVRLADATWQRMSYVPSAIRNARGQNETRLVWAHPAKSLATMQACAVRRYVGRWVPHAAPSTQHVSVPRCSVPRRLSYAHVPTYLPTYYRRARCGAPSPSGHTYRHPCTPMS